MQTKLNAQKKKNLTFYYYLIGLFTGLNLSDPDLGYLITSLAESASGFNRKVICLQLLVVPRKHPKTK